MPHRLEAAQLRRLLDSVRKNADLIAGAIAERLFNDDYEHLLIAELLAPKPAAPEQVGEFVGIRAIRFLALPRPESFRTRVTVVA